MWAWTLPSPQSYALAGGLKYASLLYIHVHVYVMCALSVYLIYQAVHGSTVIQPWGGGGGGGGGVSRSPFKAALQVCAHLGDVAGVPS